MWGTKTKVGPLPAWVRESFAVVALGFFPVFSQALVYMCTNEGVDGSIMAVVEEIRRDWKAFFVNIFEMPTWEAAAIVVGFSLFQIALMKLVPGKPSYGPITKTGHRPVYTSNGLACYFITIISFLVMTYGYDVPTWRVYDLLPQIISLCNVTALALCVVLYFKAWLAPTTGDVQFTGSFMRDYFGGCELYPRILGIDVKRFTNCRFGMMAWPVLLLVYAVKQQQLNDGVLSDSMFVCVCLQLIYVAKFFLWEDGYMCSIDIMHDCAGFYLCWGCMVYVPTMYTIHGMWLTRHPIALGVPLASAILVAGWLCVYINYDADRQRAFFRKTKGKVPIWGSLPGKIVAKYKTTDNMTRTSLLLTTGWWGISRHFHYLPEIGAAFCWSVPALHHGLLPYIYVIYLIILLTDRAFRDDARCFEKYGKYWEQYRKLVPFKLIPGVL